LADRRLSRFAASGTVYDAAQRQNLLTYRERLNIFCNTSTHSMSWRSYRPFRLTLSLLCVN